MNTLILQCKIPIATYALEYTIVTPRPATAFEGMIVFLVDYAKRTGRFTDATIPSVFTKLLGLDDIQIFITPALDELFSASLNILITTNPHLPLENTPISAIEITDDGKRLLDTGKLPSQPRKKKKRFHYNFITNQLINTPGSTNHSENSLPVELFINMFPHELIKKEILKQESGDTEIQQINPDFSTEYTYLPIAVTITIDHGNITLTAKDNKVSQYLNNVPAEMISDILFTKDFNVSVPVSDSVIDLRKFDYISLASPAQFISSSASPKEESVLLKSVRSSVSGFSAHWLEVVSDPEDRPNLTIDKVSKLTISAPFPWQENGVSNLKLIREISKCRLFIDGHPIEVNMGMERKLSESDRISIVNTVLNELLKVEQIDKYAFALRFSHGESNDNYSKIIAFLQGEKDIVSCLKKTLEWFSKWKITFDEDRLLNYLYPINSQTSIRDIADVLAVISHVPLQLNKARTYKSKLLETIEQIKVNSPEQWAEKTSLRQKITGEKSSKQSIEELYTVIDLLSISTLVENADMLRNLFARYDLTASFQPFCRSALAQFSTKQISLSDFIQVIEAFYPNEPDQRKKYYVNLDSYVSPPENIEDLIEYCSTCKVWNIPLPARFIGDKLAQEILERQWSKGQDLDRLQSISEIRPLLTLSSKLGEISRAIGQSSIIDYAGLPDNCDTKTLLRNCQEFQKTWNETASTFFSNPGVTCEAFLEILKRIRIDTETEIMREKSRSSVLVFDTCSLIIYPELLSTLPKKATLVIPRVVLQELNNKKKDVELSEDDRRNVRKVIHNINKLQKNDNLKVVGSDLALLPEDYRQDATKNDDKIISVVAELKSQGSILVTADKNLENKAMGMGLQTLTAKLCQRKLKRKEL